jgi:hypothetical protein
MEGEKKRRRRCMKEREVEEEESGRIGQKLYVWRLEMADGGKILVAGNFLVENSMYLTVMYTAVGVGKQGGRGIKSRGWLVSP